MFPKQKKNEELTFVETSHLQMCVANPCPAPLVAEVEAVVDVTTIAVAVDSTGDNHSRRSNADISSVDGTQHRVVVACRVVVIVLRKERPKYETYFLGSKSNYMKVKGFALWCSLFQK